MNIRQWIEWFLTILALGIFVLFLIEGLLLLHQLRETLSLLTRDDLVRLTMHLVEALPKK